MTIPIIRINDHSVMFIHKWFFGNFKNVKDPFITFEPPFSDFNIEYNGAKADEYIKYKIRGMESEDSEDPLFWRVGFKEKVSIKEGKKEIPVLNRNLYWALSEDKQQYITIDRNSESLSKEEKEYELKITNVVLFVTLFLIFYAPEIKEYKRKEKITRNLPGGKNKTTRATVIQLYQYIEDVEENRRKLPRRKCSYSFGVRGHYRRYKSGKVIFIKQYEKNKGKPPKQTVYQISREE